MKKYTSIVLGSMLAATNLFAALVAVQSPDGQLAASFEVENGELFYSVSKRGKPVVGSSKVEIFAGAEMAVVGQSIRDNDTSWKPVYGQFSTIRDHYRELTLSLTAGGTPVKLLCRAFDTGIGFRFVLSKESLGKELSFSTGFNNGEFVYGIDTRSYLHLIDFCADQGLEYLTVDDHWFKTAGNGKMTVAPEVDIAKVMAYAKEKGVMIMLYYDRKKGDFGDETLFNHYAGLGAAGMTYGFMGNRSTFTRNAINAVAENDLLINFHDGPVPMTGVERTMPNLITREYCHPQQDSRSAFTPETFLKTAMVSALSGPLDMANGNFGIKSINAGERERGQERRTAISQRWSAK